MNISIINGSPRITNSNSEILAKMLVDTLGAKHSYHKMKISTATKELADNDIKHLRKADCIVLAFPLYIDAIPSHLLRFLPKLGELICEKNAMVYALVNCGFYEGMQTHIALDIIKNWADKYKIDWGQGIGVGAGEMLPFNKSIPLGHGPLKNLGIALSELSENIIQKRNAENIYISPNFPKFAYRLSATFFNWHPQARKNGIKIADIKSN